MRRHIEQNDGLSWGDYIMLVFPALFFILGTAALVFYIADKVR